MTSPRPVGHRIGTSAPAVFEVSPASSTTSIASNRSTAIHEWARIRRLSSVSSLNDSSIKFNFCREDIKEGNEFLAVCRKADIEKVRKLLQDKPLLVNYVEPLMHGYTALHYAAKQGQLEVVKILVENGADVNAFTCHYTPLHLAAMGNKETVVRLLEKQAGVKLGLIDGNGRTYEDCWNRPEGKREIDVVGQEAKKKDSLRYINMPREFLFDLKKSDRTQRSVEEDSEEKPVKKESGPKRLFRKILK